MEAFIECTTLEHIVPDLVIALADKAPTVKRHTCLFLDKIIQKTYIDELQRCSSELI